jgi:hypothetical protein
VDAVGSTQKSKSSAPFSPVAFRQAEKVTGIPSWVRNQVFAVYDIPRPKGIAKVASGLGMLGTVPPPDKEVIGAPELPEPDAVGAPPDTVGAPPEEGLVGVGLAGGFVIT